MKKKCIKKCRPCRGIKCPNFSGSGNDLDFDYYYEGVINSKKKSFGMVRNVNKKEIDNIDWLFISSIGTIIMIILIMGGITC